MAFKRQRAEGEPPLTWGRALAITILLCLFYFVAPLGHDDEPLPLVWSLFVALATVAILGVLVLRRIRRLIADPMVVDLPTVAVLLVATIIAFSLIYFMLERSSPGEVAGLKTRLDSLYMVLVTTTTVGYGDLHPAGQTARAIACVQLVFNAVFLGALIRIVGFSLRTARDARRKAVQDQ
jgi:hypothetical protein